MDFSLTRLDTSTVPKVGALIIRVGFEGRLFVNQEPPQTLILIIIKAHILSTRIITRSPQNPILIINTHIYIYIC